MRHLGLILAVAVATSGCEKKPGDDKEEDDEAALRGAPSRDALIATVLDAMRDRDRDAIGSLFPRPRELKLWCVRLAAEITPERIDEQLDLKTKPCFDLAWAKPGTRGTPSADGPNSDDEEACPLLRLRADIEIAQALDGKTWKIRVDDPFEVEGRWYLGDAPSCDGE